MKFIIGKKIDMTQVWKGDRRIAVTRVQAGPCVVTQVKGEKDKYNAIQLGFGVRKEKNINKPQIGHFKSAGRTNIATLKEFRCSGEEASSLKVGDLIKVDTFESGDNIEVIGESKGKGFQGVVKRHGFHGQDKTHGNKDQERMPGSIGAQDPQRVFKGKRMGGHMGAAQITTKNLKVVDIDLENGILLIEGAVPGARNSLVLVKGEGALKIAEEKKIEPEIAEAAEVPAAEEVKVEEVKEESKEEIKKTEEIVEEKTPVVEPQAEEPAVEEKKVEVAQEPKVEKTYLDKFNELPSEVREKASNPEVMETMKGLEEKFGVDLVPVIMKVMVKEIEVENLAAYFKEKFNFEEVKAAELVSELKEKILKA